MKISILPFIIWCMTFTLMADAYSQTLTPADMTGKKEYGKAVCANGKFAFIANDITDADGEVHIFKVENNTWTPTQVLSKANSSIGGGEIGTEFGTSVASDGAWLAVSAPYHYNTSNTRGVIYFYKRNGDLWEYHSQVNDTASVISNFGASLSMDNERLAVGANRYIKDYLTDSMVFFMGAMSIFSYNAASDIWEMEAYITSPTEKEQTRFGSKVSLSGDWIMVSSLDEPNSEVDFNGVVYFYQYNSGTWQLKQECFADYSVSNSTFGEAIALQGDYAFASFRNDNDLSRFNVKILQLNSNNNTWESLKDINDDTQTYFKFGTDISVNHDFMAISSTQISGVPRDKNGKVHIYHFENDNWLEIKEYDDPVQDEADQFGNHIAAGDSGLIVAAPSYDTPTSNSGMAYVFPDYNLLPSVRAWFDADAMIIHPDTEVAFTDKSSARLTNISSWTWYLDNDNTADYWRQDSVKQTFTSSGHYPVRLRVTDGRFYNTAKLYITVFPEDRALCTDYISFAGYEESNQGIVAWNGKDELGDGYKVAHNLPMPPASIDEAYYYLATRDYINANATSGISANSAPVNWPYLAQSLADNGKSINDLNISFGVASLGNDVRAADWQLSNNKEWRIYTGGTFSIKLGDEEIIYGDMPDLTLNIAYYAAQGGTDIIDGETTVATLTNNSVDKSVEAQAIAAAIMNDVDGGDVKFIFSSIQSANQLEFNEDGCYGGYFDVAQGFLIKNCPCALVVDAGDDIRMEKNDTATLNVDAKYTEGALTYLWEPAIGLNDVTLRLPKVSTDQSRTYTVTVTDERNCQSQDQVSVNVFEAPSFTNNLCEDEIIPFPKGDWYIKGSEVCINGKFAFVFSHLLDATPSGGQVRVFKFEDGAWIQTDVLGMGSEAPTGSGPYFTLFGFSLDSKGDWLMVGAPAFGPDLNSYNVRDGVVYIYKRNGNIWNYHSMLNPAVRGGNFGYEVSLSGNSLAVGYRVTYIDNWGGDTDGGRVYMYEYNEAADAWQLNQILRPNDSGEEDGFGKALKLDGDNLIVGAPGYKNNIRNTGAIYFYEHDGSSWIKKHEFTIEETPENGFFGADIAMSGNYAMAKSNSDQVKVFEKNSSTGNWGEVQSITHDGVSDISMDDDFAVISNTGEVTTEYTGVNSTHGCAFLYQLDNGFWSKVDTIIPSVATEIDRFGYKVDLDAGKVIVGVGINPLGTFTHYISEEYHTAFVYSCFTDESIVNADFSFDHVLATLGEIQYTDLSTESNTTITSWSWDFDGDGIEDSNVPNPRHEFAYPGNYSVSLTVSDGDVYDIKTKWVTSLSDKMDSCIAYIPFRGVEARRQGIAAWNMTSNNGDEAYNIGHALQQPPASIEWAYHYMASRDFDDIDPDASAAMSANSPAYNWPNLTQALADNGKSYSDIQISFGLASLGNDFKGRDWDLVSNKEWRKYTGGSFYIRLSGEDMIAGPMPLLNLDLEYNAYLGSEDVISGDTEYTYPQDNSAASPAPTQAVAQAFLQDCGNDPFKFFFASLQPALQMEFYDDGREGGFFDVEQGYLIKACQCDIATDLPDNYWSTANADIQLILTVNGGVEPYSFEWFPSNGLDNASVQNPVANLAYNMTYKVTVTDANGCSVEDETFVNIVEYATIEGYVRNADGSKVIEQANVELVGLSHKTTLTDANGIYVFNNVIPDTAYTVIVSNMAYNTDSMVRQSVAANTTKQLNFNLNESNTVAIQNSKYLPVRAYYNGESIVVESKDASINEVVVYDQMGRIVEHSPKVILPIWHTKVPLQSGIYFVKVGINTDMKTEIVYVW